MVRHLSAITPVFSILGRPLFMLVGAALLLAGCQVNLIATPTPDAPGGGIERENVDTALLTAAITTPVRLAIPAIELDVPVAPMGWEVVTIGDQRTTQWALPEDAVGWHVNSAAAGGAGRVILSGHQVVGAAPLAMLAQGAIEVGQRILLTDSAGVVFEYEVVDVSEPIPLIGATEVDARLAAAYVAPTDEPLLTLATGWPDFSTTHRVFAVAHLVAAAD